MRRLKFSFIVLASLTAFSCSGGAQKQPDQSIVQTKSDGISVNATPPAPAGDTTKGLSPALIMNAVHAALF